MEDTQPDLFVMLCNPADEEEVNRVMRTMGYAEMTVRANPQVPAGSPMLQGKAPSAPRTTGSGVPDDRYDATEAARKLMDAVATEAATYSKEKMVWSKMDWSKLNNVEKTVLANAIQRMVTERLLVLGRVQ